MLKTLRRTLAGLALALACLSGMGLRAQGLDSMLMDASTWDLPLTPPDNTGAVISPPTFSDMAYATQHDARWILAGGSHITGAFSRRTSALAGAADVFTDIGNSFQNILRAYSEYSRSMEIYNQIQGMWKFMENYRLNVNVMNFVPQIVITDPGDPMTGMFGENPPARSYVVGFVPKHHPGWKNNAETFGDNPYWKPKGSGMKLVEVRYPHSWADLKIDASVWDNDDETQEEFQKRLLAGMYDGVTSAARYLSGVGVDNNVELAMGRMSPKAFDVRIGQAIDKKILILKRQRDLYTSAMANPSSPEGQAYSGLGAVEMVNRQIVIDNEIQKLESKKAGALGIEITRQQAWVERSNFIHQVLAHLEDPERRLTIARLSERFKKYANAWGNPGFMVTKPDLTGIPDVDSALYLIWEAITLLSAGQVPGPVPVSGGPAAESQAALTKSMYATLTYEELVGIRRLLGSESQYKTQTKAVADIDGMKGEINKRVAILEQNAIRIQKWAAINDAKDALKVSQYGKWLQTVMTPTPM